MLFKMFVKIRKYLFDRMWVWGGYDHRSDTLFLDLHFFSNSRLNIDVRYRLRDCAEDEYFALTEHYYRRAYPDSFRE